MSALRNYRRSLSERRQSLSEIYQNDAKRISESSSTSWQTTSRPSGPGDTSSDEDEDLNECSQTQAKEVKPKERQRRLSLDFLFLRKSKTESKKKSRSQSTSDPATGIAFTKKPAGGTATE